MSTRTIGLDLSVKDAHKAIVMDEQGQFVTPLRKLSSCTADLDQLLAEARQGAPEAALQVVMEPTGMAWFPVAVYLQRQGVVCYLINSQQVADLRRYYKRHAKSDRIDCRVLAKLPLVNAEALHPLLLAPAATLACQRACRQRQRLVQQITALTNRLQAIDRFAWPGLQTVFADHVSPAARWFRQHWYDPQRICQAGAASLHQAWRAAALDCADAGAWIAGLVELAGQVLALYGAEGTYLDYQLLQQEVACEQAHLAFLEAQAHSLQREVIRPLYRAIHPSRNLESLKGVGQDGAAVYVSFIGQPDRFDSLKAFRGWSGMVPDSRQSAAAESQGLHITQAGPDLVKAFAYLDADVARRYDPQIAKLYYDQMVRYGKHHNQAVCACATHLLDRILTILREDRPYELRDVDGTPVSAARARQIIAERYTVPAEVRQRNSKRKRRERQEQRTERKTKRESRPTG